MNLFINAISSQWILILFDENRNIIKTQNIFLQGNESSQLIPEIDNFLHNNYIAYTDLKNIVCVNGPGSFTWIRTIVLAINTIAYTTQTHLTDISYFELFKNFPIIKASSKRDSFFQLSTNEKIEIIENESLAALLDKKNISILYGENTSNLLQGKEIIENIDYSDIIKNIHLKKNKKISPLYIKKPNIS